jgi:predicted ATP-dependent endonuclease of OLD family
MKITEVKIHGIKSFVDTTISMSDYTVFVGENNSGKSNILFALLWFFGKEKLGSKDLNSQITDDPFVEVEFTVSGAEAFTHPSEYLVGGKFRVRGTASKSDIIEKAVSCEYFGYTGNTEVDIKDTKLMGWKTVAKPSLGDVIYMPSVRPLSEELKFTANSALNQLVTKNIIARIKIEDEKDQHYSRVVESINELSKFIGTGDGSAIQKLQKDISGQMLDYGKVKVGFDLVPPNADELIKSCFKPHTSVEGLDEKLPLTSQGDGFQRSMMFSLIANLAELNKSDGKSGKKSAKNDCTFYIIEEPELFLHPNHQAYFRNKLEEISNGSGAQVILTSHSPYFLNNVEKYSQVKRVFIDGVMSKVAEVSELLIDQICKENGDLMAKAKNECSAVKMLPADLATEAAKIAKSDHLRYLLWIDPTRANAFLSQKVILVEGPTEKALFAFLFNNPKGAFYDENKTSKVTIVDTVGKYHFYKFAKLLRLFGIKVWCVYDTDNNACSNGISHKVLNEALDQLKQSFVVEDIFSFNPNLESSLGLTKERHAPDISLYVNLENNVSGCVACENYSKIVAFVKSVIEA